MKNIFLAVLLFGCLAACTTKTPRIVENPPFAGWSSRTLEIAKIERTDTATILYIQAFFRPNNWISIAEGSYLEDNKGKRYKLLSAEGITINKHFYMPESGETEFQLFFQPVPEDVTSISFTEGDDIEGAFEIWGITLTGDLPALKLPKEAKTYTINEEADLPEAVLQNGTAVITGKIMDYMPEMASEISIWVNNPTESYPKELKPEIDSKGNFRLEVAGFSPMYASAYVMKKDIKFYIAPGETTSLVIVPREIARSQSRLHKETPATYNAAYFDGYLAALNQELNSVSFSSRDHIDRNKIMEEVYGKSTEEIRDYLVSSYEKILEVIDELSASKALKKILKAQQALELSNILCNTGNILSSAHIMKHGLQGEEAMNYYRNTSYTYPEGYLKVLNNYPVLFSNDIFYADNLNEFLSELENDRFKTELEKLGNENPTAQLIPLSKLSGVFERMDNFQAIPQEEIESFSPLYQSVIRDRYAHIEKLRESIKKSSGFNVDEAGKISKEDIFASIISKFRGKTILIDIWATWCGPCIMANKTMKPIKDELADKDIVYIYLAGENSPLEKWSEMIRDIDGEHYRLTDEQWEYIKSSFNSNGVPTYIVLNGEANVTYTKVGIPEVEKMKEELLKALH